MSGARQPDAVADLFLALSHRTRLRALRFILARPDGIDTVELRNLVAVRADIRHLRTHLDVLESAGLVAIERHRGRGQRNVCRPLPLARDLLARAGAR